MRRTRQFAAAAAVAALLVLAGCAGGLANAGAGSDAGANAGATPGDRTVHVGADAAVEAAPDRATVRVAVVERGAEARAVRNRLAENSSAMRDALEAKGYNVTSVRYDIDRDHRDHRERRRGESGDSEFVGRHSFAVRVDDPDAAGDAVVVAVENGASRVERVTFGLSDATRQKLRERAIERAMENARADAETIAESGDLRLTGVAAASTGPTGVEPVVHREVALAGDGAGGAPTRIDAGTVTVRAHVSVTYNATGA